MKHKKVKHQQWHTHYKHTHMSNSHLHLHIGSFTEVKLVPLDQYEAARWLNFRRSQLLLLVEGFWLLNTH